jgi:3-phenylpropionate/trans-cinnamate dioxygenase ferredoxin component
MQEWISVAAIEDLSMDQLTVCQVQEQEVLVYRSGNAFYVYPNRCTHQDVPLADGFLVKGSIVCRLHGAKFDLATGHCLRAPAMQNLQAYPVDVSEGQLWIKLGTPMVMERSLPTLTIRSHRRDPLLVTQRLPAGAMNETA